MYNVVLVDDHPVVSSAIRALLESQGQFKVVGIRENGISGLAAIRELRPELAIVDLGVPMLGGIEVISRLRADNVNVGILVLSGADESTSALRALRVGANGFIHKSGDLNEVVMASLLVARGKTFFSHDVLHAASQLGSAQAGPLECLTEKEFEIFRCLAEGQSNHEIGKHMLLSNKTVSAYKVKIMSKLGINNIRELIEVARKCNVV